MTVLNHKQRQLLKLLLDAGQTGAIVTGRGPAETAAALSSRHLIARIGGQKSIVMDRLGIHPVWTITRLGKELLDATPKAPNKPTGGGS